MFSRQNNMRSPEEQEQEEKYKQHILWYKSQVDELLTPERQEFLKEMKELKDPRILHDSENIQWEKYQKAKELFSEINLARLYFLMITKKNIEKSTVQTVDSLLRIDDHHDVWKNLVEMFINCGPKYQKKFLKHYCYPKFYLCRWNFEKSFDLFVTYDVLCMIKKNMDLAQNGHQRIWLEHLKKFLFNYLKINSTNFGLNFSWTNKALFTQLIAIPFWRIGEIENQHALDQHATEFIEIIDWLNDFLESDVVLKNIMFGECVCFCPKKMKNVFIKQVYGNILFTILYNISPSHDPHDESGLSGQIFRSSKQKIRNFEFIFKKLDTKIHNKFFINVVVSQLKGYRYKGNAERHKQFYDLLYHVSQHVNFKKEENWKIILDKNNQIEIESDYCSESGWMYEFKTRSIGENLLHETQRIFINNAWKNFLKVVAENDCVIPEVLPKIVYQYNQGNQGQGRHS